MKWPVIQNMDKKVRQCSMIDSFGKCQNKENILLRYQVDLAKMQKQFLHESSWKDQKVTKQPAAVQEQQRMHVSSSRRKEDSDHVTLAILHLSNAYTLRLLSQLLQATWITPFSNYFLLIRYCITKFAATLHKY